MCESGGANVCAAGNLFVVRFEVLFDFFDRFNREEFGHIADWGWLPWEFMVAQLKAISWLSFLIGGMFFVTGVLILLYPKILALLAASFFIMMGILAIGWGLRLYSIVRAYRKIRPW